VCPEQWYVYNGQCWYFSKEDEKAPWNSAQDVCKAGSPLANLISVHSATDNAIVMDTTDSEAWVGLQINGDSDFTWVDESSVDFQNWLDGGNFKIHVMSISLNLIGHVIYRTQQL
jgi:hypothetical protein